MTQQMLNTITVRVNELKSNPEIQKIMNKFKTESEANDWLIKTAIATLFGVQHN